MEKFTVTQQNRITELNGGPELLAMEFETREARDSEFRRLENEMVQKARTEIGVLLGEKHITSAVTNGHRLEQWLTGEGFTKVVTPTMMYRSSSIGTT